MKIWGIILTVFLTAFTALAGDTYFIGIKREGSAEDVFACLHSLKKIQHRSTPKDMVIGPIVIGASRPTSLAVSVFLTAEGAAEAAALSCVRYVEANIPVNPLPSLGTGN